MTELQKLDIKISKALRKRNYTECNKLSAQKKVLMQAKEQISLAKVITDLTDEERKESLRLMNKVFILSDILYGATLEFESYLKKFDKSIDVEVVNQAKQAVKLLHGITKNVDDLKDDELSEDFGEKCDNISLVVDNMMNKMFQEKLNK